MTLVILTAEISVLHAQLCIVAEPQYITCSSEKDHNKETSTKIA